jgi:hypothetical protein
VGLLAQFAGYLQADAFGGYDGIYASGRVVEVVCGSTGLSASNAYTSLCALVFFDLSAITSPMNVTFVSLGLALSLSHNHRA